MKKKMKGKSDKDNSDESEEKGKMLKEKIHQKGTRQNKK